MKPRQGVRPLHNPAQSNDQLPWRLPSVASAFECVRAVIAGVLVILAYAPIVASRR